MNHLNKISLFKNYFEPVPVAEITIQDFCLKVIAGDYKNEVEAIRDTPDADARKKMKKVLPGVTPSGTFSYREAENLIQHSGFICLDLDSKGNEETDWPALRNSLSDYENVYFSALSVSGNGLFLIIPISTPSQHVNQYRALELDFKSMGLVTDPACKDVSRLRGGSFDPEAVINPNATPYRKVYTPPTPRPYKAPATSDQLIINARKWMERNYTFAPGSRHNYIKQFTGVLHRFGVEEGTAYRELISYACDGFPQVEIEKIISSMYSKIYQK